MPYLDIAKGLVAMTGQISAADAGMPTQLTVLLTNVSRGPLKRSQGVGLPAALPWTLYVGPFSKKRFFAWPAPYKTGFWHDHTRGEASDLVSFEGVN